MDQATELAALRSELADFRDREFKGMAERNDLAHEEIKKEMKRINGEVGTLKLWKAKLEGAAGGGKALWALVAVGAGPLTAVVMRLLEK
jgi:hypothetical protein